MDACATMMRQRCRSSTKRSSRPLGCFVQSLIMFVQPELHWFSSVLFTMYGALQNDLGQGVVKGDVAIPSQFPSLERGYEQSSRINCSVRTSLSRELTKPAGRPILHRPDVVGHRPGIGYVSSKNRGIGRASCVEPIPARRRPAVSNMFDIVGRQTPTRRPAGRSSETLPQKRHLQQQKSV